MEISAMELWRKQYRSPKRIPYGLNKYVPPASDRRNGWILVAFRLLYSVFSSELPVHHPSRHHKFSSTSRILLSRLAPSGLTPKYPPIYKRPLLRGTYFIQLSLHLWVKKRWKRRRTGCCSDQFSPHAKRIIQKMWEGGGASEPCKGWSSKTPIIKHCALLQKPIKL